MFFVWQVDLSVRHQRGGNHPAFGIVNPIRFAGLGVEAMQPSGHVRDVNQAGSMDAVESERSSPW